MATPVFGATATRFPDNFRLEISVENGVEVVYPQQNGGENWLFIPSSGNVKKLAFRADKTVKFSYSNATCDTSSGTVNLTKLYPNTPSDGVYRVKVSWDGGSADLNIMKSANVPALYLKSADPAKGREWVESSPDKSNKAKGSMSLVNADGNLSYTGELTQIKGRGNSTWSEAKKPYQIKTSEKVDLLETGDNSEAHDTWVLLTNYSDKTLLGNQVMLDLSADLGIPYTPNCQSVDLYYDGEYRGNYLLCEKTQVGKGRVNIENLEKAIEKANEEVTDMDAQPTYKSKNSLGNNIQYVSGLNLPEDYSGGYLLELDYASRAMEEKTWFQTSENRYYTVKSPEYLPKAGVEYISTRFQELENAINNKGVDPISGKTLGEIADLKSMAKFFLVEEISYDFDAYVSSSYFFKDAGDDLFYSGPVWDFDAIVGIRIDNEVINTSKWHAGNTTIGKKLLACPELRAEIKRVYIEEFAPLMDILFSSSNKPRPNQSRTTSINGYRDWIKASEAMNRAIWPEKAYYGGYSTIIERWKNQLVDHNNWLKSQITNWNDGDIYYFEDVKDSDWFAGDVYYAYDKGIMKGVDAITFLPYGTVNRAMVVTMLYRIAGEPASETDKKFSDVPDGTWYSDAVKWASSNGIVEGYPDGTFCPDKNITREEFATLLYRYTDIDDETPDIPETVLYGFPDESSVSDWAHQAVAWAVDKGIINGTDEGKLEPQGNALRCQAAAMIHRFLTTI